MYPLNFLRSLLSFMAFVSAVLHLGDLFLLHCLTNSLTAFLPQLKGFSSERPSQILPNKISFSLLYKYYN